MFFSSDPLAAHGPSQASNDQFACGVQLQQTGDLTGARRAYEAALKLSPRRIDALSNLGLVYSGLREFDRAVQTFEKALEIDPRQPAVLFNAGLAYLQAGQNEKARRTLALLAGLQKDNFLARHYLGVSLLKLNRIAEGVAELDVVVMGHPDNLDAAYTLASAYIKTNQLEKARRLIDIVIESHNTAEAHLIAGSYWMATQNYRRAVVELRRAQELNPALPELGTSLGGAYAMTGSQEMARQLFEEYLRKNPADFDTLAILGWLYLESDRMVDAEKVLTKAREMRSTDIEVLFQLARIARAKGQFQESAVLLERVIAAKPRHLRAHVLLAQTYFRLRRNAEGNREREIVNRLNAEDSATRR